MADLTADNGDLLTSDTGDQLTDGNVSADVASFIVTAGTALLNWSGAIDGALVADDGTTYLTADNGDVLVVDAVDGTLTTDDGVWLTADNGDVLIVPETAGQDRVFYPDQGAFTLTGNAALLYGRLLVRNVVVKSFNWLAPVPAGLAASHKLTVTAAAYAVTGYQMTPIRASARMGADSAQFAVSSVGAALTGEFKVIQASPASFTMTGAAVSYRSGHWVGGDTGAYTLTGNALTRIRYYKIEAWKDALAIASTGVSFLYRPIITKAGGDDAPLGVEEFTEAENARRRRWREEQDERDQLRAQLEGRKSPVSPETSEKKPTAARKIITPRPVVRPIDIDIAALSAEFSRAQAAAITAQNAIAAELLLF